VSFVRATFAVALANALRAAAGTIDGPAPSVFDHLPETCNPPALVVGWPIEVAFSTAGLALDTAQVPVTCVGPLPNGEATVDALSGLVCSVLASDPQVAHTVHVASATRQSGWRKTTIGGADVTAADVIITVNM
jgi:hypothetical protein